MEELRELSELGAPQSLSRNTLVSLPLLMTSGDGTKSVQKVPVFTRNELAVLYRELNGFLKNRNSVFRFHLSGPPGSGKTLFVTLFCRMLAVNTGRRILFISYRTQLLCDVQVFDKDKVCWLKNGIRNSELATAVRKNFTDNETALPFHLCVLDGVRDTEMDANCGAVFLEVNGNTGIGRKYMQSIFVTSMGFRIRDMDRMDEVAIASLDSWTWHSHNLCWKAMLDGNNFPQLLKDDILRYIKEQMEKESDHDDKVETETVDMDTEDAVDKFEDLATTEDLQAESETVQEDMEISEDWLLKYAKDKYFYAGGCARFMYGRGTSSLKTELVGLMRIVEDWKPFTTNSFPSGSSTAVNSLMQQFTTHGNSMATAVSKFVLLEAYEKCDESLIAAVAHIAASTGNPSLGGWAFELQELSKIKKVLKSPEGHLRHLKTAKNLVLCPKVEATYDGTILDVPHVVDGLLVIWCLKWNQGCFDVAACWNGILITLQFTTSASHSLKLEYVSQLRSALKQQGVTVHDVVHCFVLQDIDLEDFKYDTPTGTGRQSCKLEYTVRVCKSTCFEIKDEEGNNNLIIEGDEIKMHSNKRSLPGL